MTPDAERLRAAFAGRYHVDRLIGAGGMATVHLARDLRQDRDVALKVMRPDIATLVGATRFAREVAIAGRLTHPNIVAVLDSGTVTVDGVDLPFYAMPFVAGETLRARLERERQLPVDDALRIVRDIGEALEFAHGQGIVHRDVKPENILLVAGRAALADFGVALALGPTLAPGGRLTGTGIAVGTPAYMSPEQSAADPALDARADTYALAVVAYEMLAGETPFTGVTPQAILARQVSGELLPLTTVRPRAVTPRMDAAIARALAPAPADRHPSTLAFVAALEEGRERRSVPARVVAPDRRQRLWTLGGLGVVVATAATLAVRSALPPDAFAADGRLGVALMPFRATAGADDLAESLPDLVFMYLDGTPGVRVPDPWALWRPLRERSDAPARSPDPTEAAELARRSGAQRFVLGSVARSGTQVDLTLRIYGVRDPDPLATLTLDAPVDSTRQLAERAAVEVIQRVWEGAERPAVPRMESLFTQVPDALKAYAAAREAMRRGMPDSADVAITRAITLDSTFALALLEAVTVRSWVQFMRGQPYSGLRQLAARAQAHADSLPPRQRLRLEATVAGIETRATEAATAWQRLLDLDSLDLDANRGLAFLAVAHGWQFGVGGDEVARYAERALRLDTADVPTLNHRVAAALGRWDPADVQRQLARVRAVEGSSPMLRGSRRAIEGLLASDAEFAARVDSLAAAPAVEWVGVLRMLRAYRPDRALELSRRTLRGATPGPMLDLGVSAASGLLLAAGDVRGADSLYAGSSTGSAPAARVRHAQRILAAALVGVEEPAVTARALADLTALVPVDSALALFDTRPAWSVAWSLGTWHAQRGDTALAKRWLALVPTFPGVGSPATWREAVAADIAARLAVRRGQADSARAQAGRAFELWSIHTSNVGDADIEPAIRFRHATALLEAGLRDSAVRVFSSFVPPHSWIGVYVPPAHLALARLAEARGDRSGAARHFIEAQALLALAPRGVSPVRAAVDSGVARSAGARLFRYGAPR